MTLTIHKKNILLFIIGSSLPAFIITMLYVGTAYRNAGRPNDVPFEQFALAIPFIFGLATVINYKLINKYGDNASILTGLILGAVFSITGRFYLDLPGKIFNIPQQNKWKVHIHASLIYPIIFRFIITPFTHYLI
jgi:hypothetical protein